MQPLYLTYCRVYSTCPCRHSFFLVAFPVLGSASTLAEGFVWLWVSISIAACASAQCIITFNASGLLRWGWTIEKRGDFVTAIATTLHLFCYTCTETNCHDYGTPSQLRLQGICARTQRNCTYQLYHTLSLCRPVRSSETGGVLLPSKWNSLYPYLFNYSY